jgi:hypothetical protein
MITDLSTLEHGDTLMITSAHQFPTTVRHFKRDEKEDMYIKTANSHQGQELHEEAGEIILYEGLDKTRIGPVIVTHQEADLPVTELQEGILWSARGERGVHHNAVVNKFDVSTQTAHEACMALGERDLLSFWANRGYWSLTTDGKDWLDEHSSPPITPYPHKSNLRADDGSLFTPHGVYCFIKTMQRHTQRDGEYNGDLLGFDPENPRIVV